LTVASRALARRAAPVVLAFLLAVVARVMPVLVGWLLLQPTKFRRDPPRGFRNNLKHCLIERVEGVAKMRQRAWTAKPAESQFIRGVLNGLVVSIILWIVFLLVWTAL
jgi:hypothetical protein